MEPGSGAVVLPFEECAEGDECREDEEPVDGEKDVCDRPVAHPASSRTSIHPERRWEGISSSLQDVNVASTAAMFRQFRIPKVASGSRPSQNCSDFSRRLA